MMDAAPLYTVATPAELQALLEAGPVSGARPSEPQQMRARQLQLEVTAPPVACPSVDAVISEAANLLHNGGYNQQYESVQMMVRISAKCVLSVLSFPSHMCDAQLVLSCIVEGTSSCVPSFHNGSWTESASMLLNYI